MAATVTLTGSTGPGVALSAVVYRDVLTFKVNAQNNVITLEFTPGLFSDISVASATTVTATKSGTTWTLVVS